ncbi:MAG: NADH-quinone oxidoreductase subunit L [Planctomycetes bacterium]|nr:NADH-quinone oxidoreductase subunit L [Planctomycetota bacterium]
MNEMLWPILIPAFAGLVVMILPAGLHKLRQAVALIAAVLTCVLAAMLFSKEGGPPYVLPWFQITQTFDFEIALRADALSRFIVLAANVFGVLVVLYSLSYMKGRERLREYYAYLMWTLAAANLALLADNLLLLLIGWEVLTVLLFLLITIGGGAAREGAGKTFVMIGASDCAMLLGIVFLWQIKDTLTLSSFSHETVDGGIMVIAYVLLLVGALTKAGAMPFHSWIPKAAEGAPVSVMAFLPAALDKLLGIYLLARISLFMFELSLGLRLALLIIGAATVILAVMAALVQHNLKKLLSFHAVSQVGYMVLGIGTGVPVGILGGLFHMLNHAVYKCCLFLCAGAVEKRAGTTEMEKLGGLARAMPLTFIGFLIASFAISGVPPFNGFVSKWLIYQGLLEVGGYTSAIFLVAALFGSALTLASFVKAIYSVFLGQRPPELANTRPAGFAMATPIAFLALICVLFGVFARVPIQYLIGPAVAESGAGEIRLAGLWEPGLATLLLLLSVAVGLVIYWLGSVGKARRTSIFVGGEVHDAEEIRVPATGFYETIRTAGPLEALYREAAEGAYDIYVLASRYGSNIVGMLRALHNGVLSSYLAFCVVGLLILMFVLLKI